jgi:hypothetical protein
MSQTIVEVIKEHRVVHQSIDALVFEPDTVEKIVVCFTGMQVGRYNRWSWFCNRYQLDKILYIIFKDDDRLFYLDRETKGLVSEHHSEFIINKLKKHNLDSKKLYTIGSSMGGYAAIYFAFKLNAAVAMATSPLADIDSATPRINPENNTLSPATTLWIRQMKALGNNWVDLDQYILMSHSNPQVFLTYGTNPPDVLAANKLINAMTLKNIKHIDQPVDSNNHADFLSLRLILELINSWPSK